MFGQNLVKFVQGLAKANQKSPTAGTFWPGTPISDMIVGKAHVSELPRQNVQGASTSQPPRQDLFSGILSKPQTGTPTYLPSTGGQSAGGGGGSIGNFDVPQGDSGDGNYVNELRNVFSNLRSSIGSMMPNLENTYNTVKADIEGGINRAKQVYGERKEDVNKGFGENLRSLLLSDRELGEKNRNVYSGLNALDSSSYGDAEIKRNQNVFDTQSKLIADKERQLREAEREYGAYEAEGNRALAQAASEWMQAKSALQQALAQNDLNEAAAIQNAMNDIKARAQQTQDTINAFKLNLAQMQAQGTNVIGNLQKLGADSLNNIFSGFMQNTFQPSMARLTIPQGGVKGAGFIGRSKAEDELKKLQGLPTPNISF